MYSSTVSRNPVLLRERDSVRGVAFLLLLEGRHHPAPRQSRCPPSRRVFRKSIRHQPENNRATRVLLGHGYAHFRRHILFKELAAELHQTPLQVLIHAVIDNVKKSEITACPANLARDFRLTPDRSISGAISMIGISGHVLPHSKTILVEFSDSD